MKISDLLGPLRHVGVIVQDLDAAVALYTKLYDVPVDRVRYVPPPGTPDPESRFAFIPMPGTEFELIEPVSEAFRNFLGNPPPGINHLAFTVSDIDQAVALMAEKGVRLGHVTRDGILDMHTSRVAYFNPEDTGGILVEYVEPR